MMGDGQGLLSRRGFIGQSSALLAVLAGGGAVLSACGSDDGGGKAGTKDKVTFLTIFPVETLSFTPELVATAGGHFADQGLDVTFQATKGSAQAIQVVLSGGAFLTWVGQIECMIANRNKDADLRTIGTVTRNNNLRFVSSSKNPLTKPEDFVGKTIGIPSAGGTTELTLDLVLKSRDIDPKKVQRQVVGLTPGVYSLVKDGRLAAFTVSLDTALVVKQQNPDAVIFNPSDVLKSGGQVYVSTPDGIAKHKDVLQRYLKAVKTAMDSVLDDDQKTFQKTLQTMRSQYHFASLTNTDVAVQTLRDTTKSWTLNGRDNLLKTMPDVWRTAYQELSAASAVKQGGDPTPWFNNDLVPAAK